MIAFSPTSKKGPKGRFRLFTEFVGDSIIPKKYRKSVSHHFQKAGINIVPYFKFGIGVYLLVISSALINILFLNLAYFSNVTWILKLVISVILLPAMFTVLLFFVVHFCILYLNIRVYYKVQKMEDVFPEFLSELSLNLKSGESLEAALENSLEKEFGPLKDEIERVSKKIKLGADVEVALKEFTSSYNSDMIEECFNLIVLSWKKGTNTPPLIDRLVDNIEENRFLKKKIIASFGSYRIFLSIVTVVIAPAMFAMAFYLIDLVRTIINRILESTVGFRTPFTLNPIRLNDTHYIWFSVMALTLISLSTAIIISIIRTGTVKLGYKNMILYPITSLISFRIFMFLFSIFFSLFRV